MSYVGLLFNKFLRDNILNKKIACNDINHGCVIVNVTKINIGYIQFLHVSRCAYALLEEKCDFIKLDTSHTFNHANYYIKHVVVKEIYSFDSNSGFKIILHEFR